MLWLTAFSMDDMGRPSPGTMGSWKGRPGAAAPVAGADGTSLPWMTPPGPLPCTLLRSTPRSPASLRA